MCVWPWQPHLLETTARPKCDEVWVSGYFLIVNGVELLQEHDRRNTCTSESKSKLLKLSEPKLKCEENELKHKIVTTSNVLRNSKECNSKICVSTNEMCFKPFKEKHHNAKT